ncbi:reverse transcriptase domain-containing protein [Chitinophaga sp. LS1]|uniref:reverse transcriptase domain-containing protein n=1 Tax=Chitinophaga sp. LS1 TaxID=3051176 RepID=UPI002AABF79D|nr:reverse transcriptase domain-containing protein [Chitinophaga sp. LS1]WPV65940.1 reverse transcriptase domain-containing protein [Chitinophaga sp. LS1]
MKEVLTVEKQRNGLTIIKKEMREYINYLRLLGAAHTARPISVGNLYRKEMINYGHWVFVVVVTDYSLPTVEDKLLQTAVSKVLTPIYEDLFYQHSYGFRTGKSQHQALEKLSGEFSVNRMRYIIDADMQNYFG